MPLSNKGSTPERKVRFICGFLGASWVFISQHEDPDDTSCLRGFVTESKCLGGNQDPGMPRDQPRAMGSQPVLPT